MEELKIAILPNPVGVGGIVRGLNPHPNDTQRDPTSVHIAVSQETTSRGVLLRAVAVMTRRNSQSRKDQD